VIDLIKEKLPVSMSLGIWMVLFANLISIPLGIRKAVSDGSPFDVWTSSVVIIGYAIPGFLFAILLIVLFAGGSFFDWFPLRGLTSDNWAQLSWWQKILDYFWHLVLPLISIPLGIRKAVKDGSQFDVWTSGVIIIGYAIPGFLFAILLIILFAGGSFFNWFPLRGLTSDYWAQLSVGGKILDYFWHLVLPITSMGLAAFATMTLLTKNSFLDEIRKQYVLTARAKGCAERQVLYGHVFRNAMLIVIAGFPGAFVHAFFSGSLLIETIFSLDGIGLLGFESVLNRDYAVVFAPLYIMSLVGLLIGLISDLTYTWVDPRIDFETREV